MIKKLKQDLDFTYHMDVTAAPSEVYLGCATHIEVKITGICGEIEKIYMKVLGYGIKVRLFEKGGKYSFDFGIPPMALKGEYTLLFYALDVKGVKGNDAIVKINVV